MFVVRLRLLGLGSMFCGDDKKTGVVRKSWPALVSRKHNLLTLIKDEVSWTS